MGLRPQIFRLLYKFPLPNVSKIFKIIMGRKPLESSATEDASNSARTSSSLSSWNQVQLEETASPARVASPLLLPQQSPPSLGQSPQPSTCPSNTKRVTPNKREWALPLESLVLGSGDNSLPLNFLLVYPSILRKFPGPPCEALGKTITYIQALLTVSPAFHPYVVHLPSGFLPTNDPAGRQVAWALEMELVKNVQNLFQFFNSDVHVVQQYINTCPYELIPAPLFVISTPENNPMSNPVNAGVEGFNNQTPRGRRVWSNPVSQSVWRQQMEHDALEENIRKCNQMIRRKRHLGTPPMAVPNPEQIGQHPRPPLPNPLPPRPQVPMQFVPPPTVLPYTPPMQAQFHPQQFAMQMPAPPVQPAPQVTPPTAPPFSNVHPTRLSMQVPGAPPQPKFGAANLPVRVIPQPIPAAARVQDIPMSVENNTLKDDITRLEAQITRILDLVSKDHHTGA